MLTLTWDTDILFEKLTPERGDEFEKHQFREYVSVGRYFMESLWPEVKWIKKC